MLVRQAGRIAAHSPQQKNRSSTDRLPRRRQFCLQTVWDYACDRDELVAVAMDIGQIPCWCGSVFMDMQIITDRQGHVGHRVWTNTKGFLPHSFIFAGEVTRFEPGRVMDIAITGDFVGTARIEVVPRKDRTRLIFSWDVDCRHKLIGWLAGLFPGLFVLNHRWAMEQACGSMAREIDRRRSGRSGSAAKAVPYFPHNLRIARRALTHRRRGAVATRQIAR